MLLIKSFLYNLVHYIINNPEKCVISFCTTLCSILITAFIGWIVYKKQQRIKYVQEDVTNFFYVFFLIIKNFEEIINMYTQYAQKAVLELNNSIKAIDAIKIIGDKYHGKIPVSDVLKLSNDSMDELLKNALQEQQQLVNLSISTNRYYWYINDKDFSKESLFLTKYGDAKFQAIANILLSVYKLLNELNSSILSDIESSREKPHTYCNEIILCDIRNNNYTEQLYKYKSRLEYKLSLFTTLKQELEKGIIYSKNALEHLECFFREYRAKYEKQLKFIGVKYKDFGLANEIIDKSEYNNLLKNRKSYEIQYWNIPNYKKIFKN